MVIKMPKKRILWEIGCSILFLFLIVVIYSFYSYEKGSLAFQVFKMKQEQKKDEDINQLLIQEENKKKEDRLEKEKEFNSCINEEWNSDRLLEINKEMDTYIQEHQYRVSVYFEDLTTGFNYQYQSNTVYYGCSLIKLVDVLYLINQAIAGNIDIDQEKIKFTKNYYFGDDSGERTFHLGEEVSLRELMTNAIYISDNSAHFMLLDYIGFDNLKNYGKSLGAKLILTGGDNFGNQTATDMNLYLKEAYRIITENESYGPFLKSIMSGTFYNDFNTDDIKIYHKYGLTGMYYHDVGLNLGEHPYSIAIMTLHGKSNHREVVQKIHLKIRALQNDYYEERTNYCFQKVYENKED